MVGVCTPFLDIALEKDCMLVCRIADKTENGWGEGLAYGVEFSGKDDEPLVW